MTDGRQVAADLRAEANALEAANRGRENTEPLRSRLALLRSKADLHEASAR